MQTALYSLFMAEGNARFPDRRDLVASRHRAIAVAIASGTPQEAREAMHLVISDGYHNAVPG